MPDFTIKRGDTYPPIKATLTDQDGAINLTSATAVYLLLSSASPLIVAACTIVDAAAGKVSYAWQASDTATVRQFTGEFEIHWAAGGVETVPNSDTITVSVVQDLGDAP